ncbi:hypothetical protein [Mycolicibacterium phlei]|uniref:hypothetical protein n=1 Tax=Mycolicibacterium phlei TaxID=1771 RepID=UPI0002F37265|nr:hypothetical protein [Mycolicibacterium phlei]
MGTGGDPTLLCARAAAEAFVYVMRRFAVRTHEIALEAWTPPGGTARDTTRRYRVAPPFWPVTLEADRTGYAVNTRGEFIRYIQRDFGADLDTDFGPRCRDLLARATHANPAFLCEPLDPARAREAVADYLVDATASLSCGNGPVVVGVVTVAPPRADTCTALECSEPWPASSPRSSTENSPAVSSTRTTKSLPS